MHIYKILRQEELDLLDAQGESLGAPIDVTDGYIHFSTAETVRDTAAKYFRGTEGLWLMAVDSDGLGASLKWEPARGGVLFPHLYAPLRRAMALWVVPLELEDGVHRFPERVPSPGG